MQSMTTITFQLPLTSILEILYAMNVAEIAPTTLKVNSPKKRDLIVTCPIRKPWYSFVFT